MATFTKYPFGSDRHTTMCVYVIVHKESGKCYVGQSVGEVGRRWRAHLSRSGSGVSAIRAALVLHGFGKFTFSVVGLAGNREELDAKERAMIRSMNCMAPHGYNLCSGGSGGRVFSLESRKKMSASRLRRFGKTIGEKERMRLLTPEQKAANRIAQYARIAESKRGVPTSRKGTRLPRAWVEKMRRSKTGVSVPKKWKPVEGSDGSRYPSVKAAVAGIGCHRSTLMSHFAGRLLTIYGQTYSYGEKAA